MKKIILSVLLTCFYATTLIYAQTDAEMKAWMDFMTPGNEHKMLAKSNGDWTAETTMWMDPAKPPTKSTGTVHNEMIMGGRYQRSTFSGEMMGQPFEGTGVVGYDNSKKKFISTWIDNMGTGIMTMEGTWDAKTKTINFYGDCVDPMTKKKMTTRETYQYIDDNTEKMEMFMTLDGKESKSMEITFKRKV